jgi:hypothetical protein
VLSCNALLEYKGISYISIKSNFDIFIGENEHIWLLIFNNVWHPFPACFRRVGACLNGVPLNDAGSS